jgi:tetratricopeptide (TPR) repeat protein
MDLYDSVLEEQPENLDALSGKARVQAWMGDYESAMSTYGQALAYAPGHLESLTGIADLLAWDGQPEAGVEMLESLLPRHGGQREVLIRLARYHLWAGNKVEARAYAERILSLDPRDPEALEIRGGAGLGIRFVEVSSGQRYSNFGQGLTGYQFYGGAQIVSASGSRVYARYDRYRRYSENVDRFRLGGSGRIGERWSVSGAFALAPGARFLPVAASRSELTFLARRGLVLYGALQFSGYADAFLTGYSLAAEHYAGRHLVLMLKPSLVETRFKTGDRSRDAALMGKAWWYLGDQDHVFAYAAYGNEAFLVEVVDALRGTGVFTLGLGGAYFPVQGFGLVPSVEIQAREGGRRYLQVGMELKLRQ